MKKKPARAPLASGGGSPQPAPSRLELTLALRASAESVTGMKALLLRQQQHFDTTVTGALKSLQGELDSWVHDYDAMRLQIWDDIPSLFVFQCANAGHCARGCATRSGLRRRNHWG
jgi:hypothetical protein